MKVELPKHENKEVPFYPVICLLHVKFQHQVRASHSPIEIQCHFLHNQNVVKMLLPWTKPDCQGEISLGSKRLNQFVKIFEIIFELRLHRLIGLNSCYFVTPGTFGIKTISALKNPLGWDAPLKNP